MAGVNVNIIHKYRFPLLRAADSSCYSLPREGQILNQLLRTMGEKIREMRREKNLTLSDLSRMTGATASLLSQIETSKANPSITTLLAIAKALNSSVGAFFDLGSDSESPVVRQSDRQLSRTANGISYYLLTPNLTSRPFEVLFNEFQPGAETGEMITHEGVEFGTVLDGKLEVCVENSLYVLNSGDSITLDSTRPHKMRNLSDKVTTALWVDYPPTF